MPVKKQGGRGRWPARVPAARAAVVVHGQTLSMSVSAARTRSQGRDGIAVSGAAPTAAAPHPSRLDDAAGLAPARLGEQPHDKRHAMSKTSLPFDRKELIALKVQVASSLIASAGPLAPDSATRITAVLDMADALIRRACEMTPAEPVEIPRMRMLP